MPVPTSWHPGEIAAQQARGYEDDVWGMWGNYEEGAPDWMELFLHQLPFLSVTTLDDEGRPWASLVTFDGRPGFIEPMPSSSAPSTGTGNVLRFTIRAPEGVPIREALLRLHQDLQAGKSAHDSQGEPLLPFRMAAVGVMLHNRRRNKLEGAIVNVDRIPQGDKSDDTFVFDVVAANTFGNCPKYINTRVLLPVMGKVSADIKGRAGRLHGCNPRRGANDLPPEALKAIQSTDLLFLATKYSGNDPASYMPDPPRLGNNHRGGPPGFLRTFTDTNCNDQRCIVLPDWSGNRLMMSFGNMSKDPCAGVTIPVWSSTPEQASGVLHMTCRARVLAVEEARSLMRGVQGAVMLWIEDWTWLPDVLPCFAAGMPSGDRVGYSPYNPPVRLLKSENTSAAAVHSADSPLLARVVDARFHSDEIGTFVFEADGASSVFRQYRPGMHIVMDCAELLDTRVKMYAHMASYRGGEKDLNDDGVRSWTLTHAAPLRTGVEEERQDRWRFEVTLRRKNRGGVTPSLFRIGKHVRESLDILAAGQEPPSSWRPPVSILGVDGSATIDEDQPLTAFYIVSGIGITPMLAHLSQLNTKATMTAIVATKGHEAVLAVQMIIDALSKSASTGTADVDLDLHLLPQGSVDAAQIDALEDGSHSLYAKLPASGRMHTTVHLAQRLTPLSLTPPKEEEEKIDEKDESTPRPPFHIPATSLDTLKSTPLDMVLICAAPTFSATAQEAVRAAGIVPEKLHVESFAF